MCFVENKVTFWQCQQQNPKKLYFLEQLEMEFSNGEMTTNSSLLCSAPGI